MAPKAGGGAPERKRGRTAKACVQCRATKTRCTFLGASTICDKCIQRGLNCSMLPPGQRVSAPDRSAPQPQSHGAAEDLHSQTDPAHSPESHEERKPDILANPAHSEVPERRLSADAAESQATPALHWPPALLSTPPQQQEGAEPRPWFTTPQIPNTSLERTSNLGVNGMRTGNGRNSMPQLHSLTSASSAAVKAMQAPRSASVVGQGGTPNSNFAFSSQQEMHQHQGQHISQFQRQFERSPQQYNKAQRAPLFDVIQGHQGQAFQSQAYQPHVQSTQVSPSTQVTPQTFPSPLNLAARHLPLHQSHDSSSGEVVDNVSIMQSIMRSETLNPRDDLAGLAQRSIPFTQGASGSSHQQQLSSLDVRALMNTGAFANSRASDNLPNEADLFNLVDDSGDLATATETNPGTDFGIFNDGLKVDQNPAEDTLQADREILRAILETKSRWRYHTAPEYTVLQLVDPALRGSMGQASKLLRAQPRVTTRHLLTIGILSRNQVATLLNVFRTNFNHWVGLPTEPDPHALLDSLLAKCPLLVTVTCCIALRLCQREVWQRFYPVLVNFLNAEFAATLLESPQNLQFVQAVCIMAIYADSLTFQEYVFDSWYLSGIGVEQLATLGTLTSSLTHVHLRLWNHLCLANVSSAVMTGRHTLISDDAMQICRRILVEPKVDRFDSCVVAELEACASAFSYFSFQKPHNEVDRELTDWKKRWSYLDFSHVQFVEPVYIFLAFLVRWTHAWRTNKNLSPGAQEFDFLAGLDAASPLDGIISFATAASMSNERVVTELNSLTAAISAVLDHIHELYFNCLSDQLHNFAFVAGSMAVRVQDILTAREDNSQPVQSALSQSALAVRRLMDRFQAASRGLDQARMHAYGLLRLVQQNAANT